MGTIPSYSELPVETLVDADKIASWSDGASAQRYTKAGDILSYILSGGRKAITPEKYGAVGDGSTDDSSAWDSAVTDAHDNGYILIIPARTYSIPSATTKSLTSHLTIIGYPGAKLAGATGAGPELFKLVSAGLTFWNVETEYLCLINAFNETTADIDELDIRNWTFTNDDQLSIRMRINYSGSGTAFKIGTVRLLGIRGNGGLGGISVSAPINYVDVDDYEMRDILVPNVNDHFNGNDMNNVGYGDGLLLGDDDPDAQDLAVVWSIGRVHVAGINDARVPKNVSPAPQVASCDGVRLLGQNMLIGQLLIEDVTTQYRTDTTAVYFKGQNSSVGEIVAINAGHHEASVVFKGARRAAGSQAKGFNIDVGQIKLFADDGEDRAAVYFGPDDIRVGYLSIEGYGGDVEDPNDLGNRLQGAGALVYCESSESERLQIDGYSIYNCSVGGTAAAVRLFTLQGYKEIRIGAGYIDTVANDNLFSTQSPSDSPTPYPIMQVFHWVETSVAARLIYIGPCHARNFSGNGSDVRLITMSGAVNLDRLVIHSPICDATVNDAITLSSAASPASTIGHFELIGGDVSAAVDNQLTEAITPTTKRVLGCKGVVGQGPMIADTGSSQVVSASTDERVEYTNGDADGWDDTLFEYVVPEAGWYEVEAFVSVRPDVSSPAPQLRWHLEIVKSNGLSPPTENVQARATKVIQPQLGATSSDYHDTLNIRRYVECTAGEKLFAQISHDAGTNQVATGGGNAAENFIQIRRIA